MAFLMLGSVSINSDRFGACSSIKSFSGKNISWEPYLSKSVFGICARKNASGKLLPLPRARFLFSSSAVGLIKSQSTLIFVSSRYSFQMRISFQSLSSFCAGLFAKNVKSISSSTIGIPVALTPSPESLFPELLLLLLLSLLLLLFSLFSVLLLSVSLLLDDALSPHAASTRTTARLNITHIAFFIFTIYTHP